MSETPEQLPAARPDDISEDLPAVAPLVEPIASTAPEPLLPLRRILALAGFGVVYLAMLILGGEFRTFAVTGLFAIPFMILVVLAYSADLKSGWRNALTLVYWTVLIGITGFLSVIITFAGIAAPTLGPAFEFDPTLEQSLRILASMFALLVAGAISLAFFLPAVRRKAARLFEVDPQSFVHATALATVCAITLMCLVPLLAVGGPPLLPMLQVGGTMKLPPADEQLRSTLYSLIWAVPGTFLAVGYPLRRTMREARQRLGLEMPSLLQLVFAIFAVVALLLLMPFMGHLIDLLWKFLGWPTTDQESLKLLFGFAAGPVGAVIASLVAGLGEELVFRGVLQPRLGILLPALMFTAVHAFQYNFDALIQVLFLGVIFGFVRKRTNTTTSAIIHFGYDLVLLLTMTE